VNDNIITTTEMAAIPHGHTYAQKTIEVASLGSSNDPLIRKKVITKPQMIVQSIAVKESNGHPNVLETCALTPGLSFFTGERLEGP